jgi:hypothetical protein
VLNPELGERPADLGQLILGDLPARLGGDEVVARPVGVERARQALRADHLGQCSEGAQGAFLVDQRAWLPAPTSVVGAERRGRVDLGCGIVHGHDQVEILIQRRQPAVR